MQDHIDLIERYPENTHDIFDEVVFEAVQEAVRENWLHGIPASTWQDGKIVYVWPSDEEIKNLPCYELIANQVKRELSIQNLPHE